MNKLFKCLHKLVVFMPWINIFFLFVMIAYVYFTTGNWPAYNKPDPKDLLFLYPLYFISLLSTIILILIYAILLLSFLITKYHYAYKYALVFFIGLVFMILPIKILSLGDWLAD